MNIKKFNEFIKESILLDMKSEWSQVIRDTPELSNLVSDRKIILKDNKISFDENDESTVEILKTYLGIDLPDEKQID
jgi:hypothetical protein